jgi:hypothetical protein
VATCGMDRPAILMVALLACVPASPVAAQTLIGKMTGAECRALGGVPVAVIPTYGQNPDPVRACFVGPGIEDIQPIQPAWLCPDGKTPISAPGPCPG